MYRLCTILAFASVAALAQKAPDLPAPFATPDAANPPKVIARPESAKLTLPKGFTAEEYAAGLQKPRYMALGPGGEVILAESVAKGAITVLTDGGKTRKKLIDGIERPSGVLLWKDYLYVAEPTAIKRYKYDSKTLTAGPAEEIISLKGYEKGHWTRALLADRKADKLYVAIGSSGDHVIGDPENRAAISRYNFDGTGAEIIATGTRNPVAIKFIPGTDQLWTAVQERDHIGDDLVPDYFTSVRKGAFYGWPYAYAGPHEDPRSKGQKPELVDRSIPGDVMLPPHAAVLDFLFYTGKSFPAEYRNGAFLAFHGSSNRALRVGYSVAFVPFKNGKPAGTAHDFMSGWMLAPDQKEVWGRPVGLLQLADGSLLVSDDGGNRIWRVSYKAGN